MCANRIKWLFKNNVSSGSFLIILNEPFSCLEKAHFNLNILFLILFVG